MKRNDLFPFFVIAFTIFASCDFNDSLDENLIRILAEENTTFIGDTTITFFSRNGKLDGSVRFVGGRRFGTTNIYYGNQNLGACYFFNFKGEAVFQASFEREGKLSSKTGKPLLLLFEPDLDSLAVNDTLNIYAFAPRCTGCNHKLELYESAKDKNFLVSDYIENDKPPLFQYLLESAGNKTLFLETEIRCDKHIIVQDTTWITFLAKERINETR